MKFQFSLAALLNFAQMHINSHSILQAVHVFYAIKLLEVYSLRRFECCSTFLKHFNVRRSMSRTADEMSLEWILK